MIIVMKHHGRVTAQVVGHEPFATRHSFEPGTAHVKFVENEGALGQFLLRIV